jgi:hypothetical protein
MTAHRLLKTHRLRDRLLLCGGIFLLLVGWMLVWRYTGEDDSVLHYLNAREMGASLATILGAWSRPLYKLLIGYPAHYGIVPARVTQALLTTVLAWQTIRLAEDLEIDNAWLAAAMLIWQPLVFALGSDTMTELPFALGLVIALRLWHRRRTGWMCLVCGLLPMVRPEGCLIAPAAVLLAVSVPGDRLSRRIAGAWPVGVGVTAWALACEVYYRNWHYFIDVWSWPAHSYASYGHGPLLYHVVRWPWYCGWALFPLFCLGLVPSVRRRAMWAPLGVWLGILGVHSVLFWRGWFASIGEMRILVTTSPVTALVCLHGWNVARGWVMRHVAGDAIRRWAGVAFAVLATAAVMVEYARHARHYACFGVQEVASFIRTRHLLADCPIFFTGDKMVLAALEVGDEHDRVLESGMTRRQMLRRLRALPVGSVGMWDNRNAQRWYGITIEELNDEGFETLYESRRSVWDGPEALLSAGWRVTMRYVVLKKTRGAEGAPAAPRAAGD